MQNIAKALSKFHQLVPDIPRDASNPYFKSKYAPLETILPTIKKPLADSELVFTQIPVGLNALKTMLIHVPTGEAIEGIYEMTPTKNDPQGEGSTLTYMRRYALVAMLGLNTEEDDDGNMASQTKDVPKNIGKPTIVKHDGGPSVDDINAMMG